MSERALSEEPATGLAVLEAQPPADPLATGVFAEEEWSTDAAFLTELESLFNSDVCPQLTGLSSYLSIGNHVGSAPSAFICRKACPGLHLHIRGIEFAVWDGFCTVGYQGIPRQLFRSRKGLQWSPDLG